ncbi:MAG: septum formation family protein [Dactylosporangium sp.]|nr:septum formation family protein [Dactylosporangium sp.]NNJ63015.1 septum formation family protein [Dactylosporangium sp.]
MRRGVIGTVLVAAMALAVSGCTKPAGVDGDLINGWALPEEPKIPVPTALACYDVATEDPTEVPKWPEPVDCDKAHTIETLHVGQFDGAEADRTSPPPSGSAGRRQAFEQCSVLATEYLGADWRTGRLELFLVLPIELHWDAGARWYRCDLLEYTDLEDFEVVKRDSSVKGGLAEGSPLALTCATVKADGDTIDKVLPTACSSAHNGEFAGVYDHPDGDYSTDSAARSKANLAGCRGVVAAYAGIPNDKDFQYRVGQVASPFSKAAWELGNRGVRCYVWTPKNVTASVKGAGTSGLPINYA